MKTEQKKNGAKITRDDGLVIWCKENGFVKIGEHILTDEDFTAIASVRHGLKAGINCK